MSPEPRFMKASLLFAKNLSAPLGASLNELLNVKIAAADRFGNVGDVGRQRSIFRKRRCNFSHSSECTFDANAGFQRTAMFQAFSSGEQLDSEQIFGQVDDRT